MELFIVEWWFPWNIAKILLWISHLLYNCGLTEFGDFRAGFCLCNSPLKQNIKILYYRFPKPAVLSYQINSWGLMHSRQHRTNRSPVDEFAKILVPDPIAILYSTVDESDLVTSRRNFASVISRWSKITKFCTTDLPNQLFWATKSIPEVADTHDNTEQFHVPSPNFGNLRNPLPQTNGLTIEWIWVSVVISHENHVPEELFDIAQHPNAY